MNKDLKTLHDANIPNYMQEYQWMKQATSDDATLSAFVQRRIQGEPLAYILNNAHFFDLELFVDHRVLIPRPETEHMIEAIISSITSTDKTIIDLGTGSGCIALMLKKAFPQKQIIGIDNSFEALSVALINQSRYPEHPVEWVAGNWLEAIDLNKIDVIITNPPYVEQSWQHDSISHEPDTALFADDNGLQDIKTIIEQITPYALKIWIEHGENQEIPSLFPKRWHVKQHHDQYNKKRFVEAVSQKNEY